MPQSHQDITTKNAFAYDEHAADWQAAHRLNVGHKYLEKPAMRQELPQSLAGLTVLCIGVGSGEELSEILSRHPEIVVAIDISEKLLKLAEKSFPQVVFKKMDMLKLDFQDASFDLVYASLALHYAHDWDALCRGIHRILRPNGILLFSVHHPDYWAKKPTTGNVYTNQRGVTLTEHNALLPGRVEIIYYNHPSVESMLDAVTYSGFNIEKAYAPSVVTADINKMEPEEIPLYQNLQQKNSATPLFFVVRAIKNII